MQIQIIVLPLSIVQWGCDSVGSLHFKPVPAWPPLHILQSHPYYQHLISLILILNPICLSNYCNCKMKVWETFKRMNRYSGRAHTFVLIIFHFHLTVRMWFYRLISVLISNFISSFFCVPKKRSQLNISYSRDLEDRLTNVLLMNHTYFYSFNFLLSWAKSSNLFSQLK